MGYEKLTSKVGRRPATNHVACGGLGPYRVVLTNGTATSYGFGVGDSVTLELDRNTRSIRLTLDEGAASPVAVRRRTKNTVRLVSTPLAYALPEFRGESIPLTVAGVSERGCLVLRYEAQDGKEGGDE